MLHLLPAAIAVLTLAIGEHDDNPAQDPREAKAGKAYQWQANDGLAYEYFVPKDYDPERGANVTVVLHGNGLDHRWTFWNHPVGQFRVADILVSPDGTTPHAGTGANEFLGDKSDAERVHALLSELREIWNVRQVFLYGHSQGSFFVFYYAGLYPEDVSGVCGHASGVWNWTTMSKKGHHQAIGVLHGTDDHVPYGQGWWGRKTYREARYPLVHLRTLFDRDHRPHWVQAQQVLAWCEGMTSEDPQGVAACMDTLSDTKAAGGVDWSALWAVANRLSELDGADDSLRKRAAAVAAKVDELAAEHVADIDKSLGKKGRLSELDAEAYVGHAIRFFEEFEGVPAHDAWTKKNKKALSSLEKNAEEANGDYWKEKDTDPAAAFTAGLFLLEQGYTHYNATKVLRQLEAWEKDAKTLGLRKADLKRFETAVDAYREGRQKGFAAYEKRNGKAKLPR